MILTKSIVRKMAIPLCILLLAATVLLPVRGDAFGYGSRGPDVYAVQGMLKSLGYFAGTIDGVYGNQTAYGVRLFQRAYGLPVTGAVDAKTLQSILWAYSQLRIRPAKPPAPKPPAKPPTAPQPAPVKPPATGGLGEEEQLMLQLINKERTSRGIKALIADPELSRVAEIKSQDMVKNNYFSHQSPTYGSPFEMMKRFGISFRSAGENIACNQTVQAAHQALMASKGHRENILNASFTHVGIGIVNGGPCGKMFTQLFVGR